MGNDLNNWNSKYYTYIEKKQNGLKKEAKCFMEKFIEEFKGRNAEDKRRFIVEINQLINATGKVSLYFPINFYREAVIPTINQWLLEEPNNAFALRLSGDIDSLKKLVQLYPSDQAALESLGDRIRGKIYMNQHELESGYGYSGVPENDVALIDFYLQYIDGLINQEMKTSLLKDLNELRIVALRPKV